MSLLFNILIELLKSVISFLIPTCPSVPTSTSSFSVSRILSLLFSFFSLVFSSRASSRLTFSISFSFVSFSIVPFFSSRSLSNCQVFSVALLNVPSMRCKHLSISIILSSASLFTSLISFSFFSTSLSRLPMVFSC